MERLKDFLRKIFIKIKDIFLKIKLPKRKAVETGFQVDTFFAEYDEQNIEDKKPRMEKEIIEWLEVLTFAVILVVIIFTFFFRVATIEGTSMKETLYGANRNTGEIGDKVIISNLNYTPKCGDIVVISRNIENSLSAQDYANAPIIKRVIAVGGQTVNIDFKKGLVYVDGEVLVENYTSSPTVDKYDVEFPLYVPEGYIFVLGDNRAESLDSRNSRIGENGLIDTRYVLGKALYRIFPFNRIGGIYENE